MWLIDKVKIIPILVGATGEITKNNLKINLMELGLEYQLYISVQKSPLVVTVLSEEELEVTSRITNITKEKFYFPTV